MATKDNIIHAIQDMPEDVSIDQVIEKLYLLSKIEEGLRQADAGDVVDHEVVKKQFLGNDP